jgi:hypothetical protein
MPAQAEQESTPELWRQEPVRDWREAGHAGDWLATGPLEANSLRKRRARRCERDVWKAKRGIARDAVLASGGQLLRPNAHWYASCTSGHGRGTKPWGRRCALRTLISGFWLAVHDLQVAAGQTQHCRVRVADGSGLKRSVVELSRADRRRPRAVAPVRALPARTWGRVGDRG